MKREFSQIQWDAQLEDDCRQLIRLAVREDLDRGYDCATLALVPEDATGRAAIVVRQAGVIAGLPAARLVLDEMEISAAWTTHVHDGSFVDPQTTVAEIAGAARDLLTSERLILNLLGRLSGIATLTHAYVQAVAGTKSQIYDTRKTTPGWRRLEKYAVRCGGGMNHRTGLFDAVLIKDNHLALAAASGHALRRTPAAAVRDAQRFLAETGSTPESANRRIVEVEVDTLDQLRDVLPAEPDIVLLDNMSPEQLRQAVVIRDDLNPKVELEASGGIRLDTVRAVALSGVERISVGALTHSAICLDVGLDWR